jgi:hypothetical protein
LEQRNELLYGEARLSDDCAQRTRLQVLSGVHWN